MDEGSFTAAAETLEISKSVVSKYVSRLEARLGVRLLERTTRRLSLTEAGRVFYEQSRRGLELLDEAEDAVSSLQAAPRGKLRISAPIAFGSLEVTPLLPAFLKAHPELSVELCLSDAQVDLVGEGFDVAVRVAELPDSSLVARRVGACPFVICASPTYLAERGRPQRPEDLEEHQVLTFRHQASRRRWHFQSPEGEVRAVEVSGALELDNSLAVRQAAVNHGGVTRSPRFIVDADLAAGRLEALLTRYETIERSVYVLYPQRRYLSPKVRAFVELMAARFSPRGDRRTGAES